MTYTADAPSAAVTLHLDRRKSMNIFSRAYDFLFPGAKTYPKTGAGKLALLGLQHAFATVSYTHLDVYTRQAPSPSPWPPSRRPLLQTRRSIWFVSS